MAAKIGQSLLERNHEIQLRNEFLEEQLSVTNEQVVQLKHELQQKIQLLHVYSETETDSAAPSAASTPSAERRAFQTDLLRRKLDTLETENTNLKLEVSGESDSERNATRRARALSVHEAEAFAKLLGEPLEASYRGSGAKGAAAGQRMSPSIH